MSDLPNGWSLAPLMENVDLHDSRRIPLNQRARAKRQGPFPYYGANGQVDSINDYIFDGEFILLAEDGGYFDDPARGVAYEVSGKFWVNNHAHILSPKNGIPRRYLTYALNQLDWMPHVGGSTRLKLTQEGMRKIRIPLAPLAERDRIVAKLDSLFSRSESAREDLAHIPRLVERYRGAVLAAAFRGGLTQGWRLKNGTSVDREWRQTTLGEISIDVRYGTAAKCHYEPKTTPVLRIPNVINGRIDLSDLKYGSFSKEEEKKLALKAGDLLVIRSNGSLDLVGRVALVPKTVAGHIYAGYLIRIRLDCQRVDPAFVQHAFDEPSIRQHIESLAKSTSGVNNINSEQLRAIRLKIPPLEEQKEIVDKIQVAFSSIDHLRDEAGRADKLLVRLDQATLAKAFRGELFEKAS